MVAIAYNKMLRDVQQIVHFVVYHSHLIPQMQRDTAENEGGPNLTIGP